LGYDIRYSQLAAADMTWTPTRLDLLNRLRPGFFANGQLEALSQKWIHQPLPELPSTLEDVPVTVG